MTPVFLSGEGLNCSILLWTEISCSGITLPNFWYRLCTYKDCFSIKRKTTPCESLVISQFNLMKYLSCMYTFYSLSEKIWSCFSLSKSLYFKEPSSTIYIYIYTNYNRLLVLVKVRGSRSNALYVWLSLIFLCLSMFVFLFFCIVISYIALFLFPTLLVVADLA